MLYTPLAKLLRIISFLEFKKLLNGLIGLNKLIYYVSIRFVYFSPQALLCKVMKCIYWKL